MKSLIFTLLFLASCSSVTPGKAVTYEASTIDRECKRIISGMDVDFSSVKKEDVRKWEQFSGYRSCEYLEISNETIQTKCEKPNPFKKITTTNLARCHRFVESLNNY